MTPIKAWENFFALTQNFFMSDFDIKETLRMTVYVGAIIVTFGSIILFLIGWKNRWLERLKPFKTMVGRANSFMDEILPSMMSTFETKGLAPEGTLAKWTTIVSQDVVSSKSPKFLTKSGEEFLEDTGMKNIIDENLTPLISTLEKEKLDNAFDVEERAFYVIKEFEDSRKSTRLKNYLYSHSNETMESIILVGSIYLRDKYLEKYPKLKVNENSENQDEEELA